MQWINCVDKLPDVFAGKFEVILQNGDHRHAYYYEDAIGWIAFYGLKTGHWWNSKYPHDRLDNVMQWGKEDE